MSLLKGSAIKCIQSLYLMFNILLRKTLVAVQKCIFATQLCETPMLCTKGNIQLIGVDKEIKMIKT